MRLAYPDSLEALPRPVKYLETITQIQHNRIKNPNWQEAISWLFTSVAEDMNSESPREEIEQVLRAGLEPGTAGLRARCADNSSATMPLSMFMATIFTLKTAPM